jgi:hypothetical protein
VEEKGLPSKASPNKNTRPYLENKAKSVGGGIAQVVDCLHSKYKTLSSNLKTTKKEK